LIEFGETVFRPTALRSHTYSLNIFPMNQNQTTKYIIYIRKSSDEKTRRQVLSLSAQLFELRKFAQANKLTVFKIIRESKTAKKPGREKFNAMLDDIERGLGFPIGILSWHPDRLTRNKVDETRISVLLDAGKLSDLKFPTHMFVNDASGKYFLSIQMANAKYFIEKLSE
jgi:DNA invertase Pin-like site-specific DNA recombinase